MKEVFIGIVVLMLVFYILLKVLKKVIKAILVFSIIVLVAIGGFLGMIYLDYGYYSKSLTNFNLDIYIKDNDFVGVSLPIRNHSLDVNNIKDAPHISALDDLPIDGHISLIIPQEVYRDLISDVKLSDTGKIDVGVLTVNVTLSKDEFFEVLNSNDPKKTLIEILVRKNDFDELSEYGFDPNTMFENEISNFINSNKVGIKGILVLMSFREVLSNKDSVVKLINDYKNDKVLLIPERPSLKILKRYIPTEKILVYIEGNS